MSEELRRGIPKAIPIGERRVLTQEEKDKADSDLLEILKEYGVVDKNETVESWKAKALSYDEWLDMKANGMTEEEWIRQREAKGENNL